MGIEGGLLYRVAGFQGNECMSDFLNKNPAVTISVAAVLIVVALVIMFNRFTSDPVYKPPPPRKVPLVWFYDRNTKQLFTMPVHESGPVERDSGPFNGEPAGVRAHVFACGDCGTAERFVGYLEKPSPREADTANEEILETDLTPLIAHPDDGVWYNADSQQGVAIMASIDRRCGEGQKANYCPAKEEVE